MSLTSSPLVPASPLPFRFDVHIVPSGSSWAVKAENLPSYLYVARTQREAIAYGIELARDAASQLLIHGKDGRFRDVRVYK